MYIVNALVRSVLLFKVIGKRTNHILTVSRQFKTAFQKVHLLILEVLIYKNQ